MEVGEYWRLARRGWAVLTALAVLGALLGAAYWLVAPKTYTATAEGYVVTKAAADVNDLTASSTYLQQVVKSYADVADKPYVLRPVIRRLGLHTTPASLATHVTAATQPDTAIIDVTVTYPSRTDSARIANAVVDQLRRTVTSLSPSSKSAAATIKIVETGPASTPLHADGPGAAAATAIGAALGLLLGLIIAFARDRLDTRVRTPQALEAELGLPLLGSTALEPSMRRKPFTAVHDDVPEYAETLRSLAVNLEFLPLPAGGRSIVVTSSVAGEGRTTTAINLGALLAEAGKRVLLIDSDLRRPRVAEYLGLHGNAGLTDVLLGRADRTAAVQRWGDNGLDVLVSGSAAPNPSELIRSPAFETLIAACAAEYDFVLLDAPPLLAVSDAAVLARRTAGALLVAAVDQVRRPQIADALAALTKVDATCLGVVATMVPRRLRSGYGSGAQAASAARGRRGPRRGATPASGSMPDAATS